MRRIRTGSALVFLFTFLAFAPGVAQKPPPPEVGRWQTAAARHEPGKVDDEAIDIGGWPHERIWGVVVPYVVDETSDTWDAAALKRGAMLHSDIAWLGLNRSDLQGLQSVALNADGQGLGGARTNAHLDVARTLLLAIRPAAPRDPDVRLWFRATSAWFLRHGMLGDLTHHLARAGTLFSGNDAVTQLDRGTLFEAQSAPLSLLVSGDGRRDHTGAIVPARRSFLLDAERAYQRAFELDPSMVEARIRRGRVLTGLGRRTDGVRELRAATASTDDPLLRYWAHLFLGRALETAGDDDEARAAFERAHALYPRAQSPVLSLSRIADATGAVEAADPLAALLGLQEPTSIQDDPWLTYHEGIGRDVEDLIERLRSRMRALHESAPDTGSRTTSNVPWSSPPQPMKK